MPYARNMKRTAALQRIFSQKGFKDLHELDELTSSELKFK
jgi:hypothetical protein